MHRYTYAKCQRVAETVHGTTTTTTTTTTSADIDPHCASAPGIVRAERAIVLPLLVPDPVSSQSNAGKEWEQKASSTVF